ncbi:hypothetical protein ACI6QG_01360 [Roseococcus sp. DSY-14]|uniref:SPW repeat domain-containing protein n=1 Tax=Roseococcus sp. DSY-14 TaxID=3369650 RepID=UPI00387B80D9
MRFLPTRLHGILDYAAGLGMLATPFLMGLHGLPAWLLWVAGAGALLYAALTRYELGLWRVMPMNIHLGLDVLAGLALVGAPFLLGIAGRDAWPLFAFGTLSLLAGLFTRAAPDSAPADALRV